jgi:hypothetical protein
MFHLNIGNCKTTCVCNPECHSPYFYVYLSENSCMKHNDIFYV